MKVKASGTCRNVGNFKIDYYKYLCKGPPAFDLVIVYKERQLPEQPKTARQGAKK